MVVCLFVQPVRLLDSIMGIMVKEFESDKSDNTLQLQINTNVNLKFHSLYTEQKNEECKLERISSRGCGGR